MKEAIVLFGATALNVPLFSADMLWRTKFKVPDATPFFEIDGKKILFLSPLEVERGAKEAQVDEVVSYWPYVQKAKKAGKKNTAAWSIIYFLRERGVGHIVVPPAIPYGIAKTLSAHFKVVIADGPFYPQRAIKTEWEIQEIEKAQRAVEVAVKAAMDWLKCTVIKGNNLYHPGLSRVVTSHDLRKVIDGNLYQQGYLSVAGIVACGAEAADPHCVGHGLLRPYEPIVLDIFPRSRETLYFADQSRTVYKGEPSKSQKRKYQAVLESQEGAIDMVKDGVDGLKIYKWVMAVLKKMGFPTEMKKRPVHGFIHGVGHCVGINLHESPRISAVSEILHEGNVVTVEPGLYYPPGTETDTIPVGGIRIEDMVLVTKDGCRNLTKFPKDLDSMTIE